MLSTTVLAKTTTLDDALHSDNDKRTENEQSNK